jgi:hypothetical protein
MKELYLGGPFFTSSRRMRCASYVAKLLPPTLKRLSWSTHPWPDSESVPSLAHLTRLSYLQLLSWHYSNPDLPPSVRELELYDCQSTSLRGLLGQQEVVTGLNWRFFHLGGARTVGYVHGAEHLASFSNMKLLDVGGDELSNPLVCEAMAQMGSLSALRVHAFQELPRLPMGGPVGMAAAGASFSSLRNLDLQLQVVPEPNGLSAATGLTRLSISEMERNPPGPLVSPDWAQEVGQLQRLRWLSVPSVLLWEGTAWLGDLQQLRVLALHGYPQRGYGTSPSWAEDWGLEALPPGLRVLGVVNLPDPSTAFRQLLGSRGCEVVLDFNVDQLADPAQQLAGLPEGLQQALRDV